MNVHKFHIVINLLVCIIVLFCGNNKIFANTIQLGPDRCLYWYVDNSNSIQLNNFNQIPRERLQIINAIPSFGFSNKTYWLRTYVRASDFNKNDLWLKLGPTFIDHLIVYYRESNGTDVWHHKEFGDRSIKNDNDIVSRDYVLVLPKSLSGYDLVFKIRSTSTLLFWGTLADPQHFLENATWESALWSFYFGIAIIVSAISLCFAVKTGQRLFWGLCVFSLNYILVAALHGFPVWLLGIAFRPVQDYMVSALSLLGYSTAIWLHCEIFQLKKRMRFIYKLLTGAMYVTLLLQLSVPFGMYGNAIQFESIIFSLIAPVLIISSIILWRRHSVNLYTLLVGLMPPVYVIVVIFILLTLNGVVPFNKFLSSAWQFTLLIHAISVIILAGCRVRDEHKELEYKKKIAQELRIVRNASFNQRQFLGMVVHEYRNPLSVMKLTLADLKQQRIWSLNKSRFERIERAVTRLTQLTDNCLIDARLSSSSLHMVRKRVSLFDIIKRASTVVELSDHHHMVVTCNGCIVDIDNSVMVLFVDAELIAIAMSNILDNSVKYTTGGEINIDIIDAVDYVEICFSDEGEGIQNNQRDKVFEIFYRSKNNHQKIKGTGLGLYVSQQIIRAHGGDLYLSGDAEVAKKFIIRLDKRV
ncbi:sensor histidine kinase [Klebsiella variicola]|uniref:sensor histidine kinase n=1 Tax=Klebsiella variicola TaxID=244366 RepID=UPI003D978499